MLISLCKCATAVLELDYTDGLVVVQYGEDMSGKMMNEILNCETVSSSVIHVNLEREPLLEFESQSQAMTMVA